MRSPSSRALALLLVLLTWGLKALADKPDEAALQALWPTPQNNNHAASAREAIAFEQRFPVSPLVPIARGLAAWHLLEAGDVEGGRRVLEKMLAATAGPIDPMGAEMARHWLTRLDREQVVGALRKAYSRDLEFPVTLDAVTSGAGGAKVPMTDRWGASWLYTPTTLKNLAIGDRQNFVLESKKLGTSSDLGAALVSPYGAGFTYKPAKVLPSIGGKAVMLFQNAAGKTNTLSEGAAGSDLGFACLGESYLVITNGDYWSLQPRPATE